MKKPLIQTGKGSLPLAEMDPKAFEKSPLTRAFFLSTCYDGEEGERKPGTLILRADANRWTVSLKEPTACTQLFLAAPTLSDLWKLVEAVLGEESAPWADDPWARERRPRGRGK